MLTFLTRQSWVHMVELLIDASECSKQTFSDVKFHADFKYDVGWIWKWVGHEIWWSKGKKML